MAILDMPVEKVGAAIKEGRVTICVVGLGYVGLPLAALLAEKGAKVIGADINEKTTALINSGKSHIHETDSSTLLKEGAKLLGCTCPNCGAKIFDLKGETFCPSCGKIVEVTPSGVIISSTAEVSRHKFSKVRTLSDVVQQQVKRGNLEATTDIKKAISQADVIVATIPTPLQNGKPDLSYLEITSENIAAALKKGQLVILKSTVSPGTTENVLKPILEKTGLKAGKDFGLAYIPERIAEGNALFEFQNIPRVCGGVSERDTKLAAAVFSVLGPRVYEVSSPSIAEAAKLFENTYRDVNIALANEFALVCEALGLDVTQVIDAANTNPKARILFPSCGVGGYCLTKDSFYLIEPALEKGYNAELIRKARKLNEQMPAHTVGLAEKALGALKEKKVVVLGLSFKGNTDDTRETPAKTICSELKRRGAKVYVFDPFVPKEKQLEFGYTSNDPYEALSGADCLMIAADHTQFKNLDLAKIKSAMRNPLIVDGRNLIDRNKAKKAGFAYFGIGR